MTSSDFGIPSIIKSIGLPCISDGYIIDYIVDGEWRHFSGVIIVNGTDKHPDDLEFAMNVIDANVKEGITRENVSHIARIIDYDGDPPHLEEACTDIKMMNDLMNNHEYKMIVVNKELFIKFFKED